MARRWVTTGASVGAVRCDTDTSLNRTLFGTAANKLCGMSTKRSNSPVTAPFVATVTWNCLLSPGEDALQTARLASVSLFAAHAGCFQSPDERGGFEDSVRAVRVREAIKQWQTHNAKVAKSRLKAQCQNQLSGFQI